MASAGDHGAIGGEAGRRKKNQKRISDCLGDSDGADEVAAVDDVAAGAESPPPSPGTPRLRVPMFTCARFRFVRLGRKGAGGGGGGGGRKEQVAAMKSEAASVDSSGRKAASSRSASSEAGMGLSLLFLLAKTCVELNKMAEVRAQMEALLEEMRDQLAMTKSTDHAAAPPRTRDLHQLSTTASPCRASGTDTNGGRAGAASSSSSKPGRPRFRRLQEGGKRRGGEFYGALTGNPLFDLGRGGRAAAASSSAMKTASSGESETASEVESPASMDLAGQFQLNRNTDEQETSESSESGSDGEFIELEGGFGGGNNNNPRRRDSVDGGDEEERGDDDGDGVSALELERRLHELRHRRNRERIEELESSLRRAERKLMEKETEARLWKDTAKLALQPPTPPAASSSSSRAGHASCMQ